mgnify:CR=1 FL=1
MRRIESWMRYVHDAASQHYGDIQGQSHAGPTSPRPLYTVPTGTKLKQLAPQGAPSRCLNATPETLGENRYTVTLMRVIEFEGLTALGTRSTALSVEVEDQKESKRSIEELNLGPLADNERCCQYTNGAVFWSQYCSETWCCKSLALIHVPVAMIINHGMFPYTVRVSPSSSPATAENTQRWNFA